MAPCPRPLSTVSGPLATPGRGHLREAGMWRPGPGWGWGAPVLHVWAAFRLTQLEFKCWPLLSPEWPGVSAALGPGPPALGSSQPSRPAPALLKGCSLPPPPGSPPGLLQPSYLPSRSSSVCAGGGGQGLFQGWALMETLHTPGSLAHGLLSPDWPEPRPFPWAPLWGIRPGQRVEVCRAGSQSEQLEHKPFRPASWLQSRVP